MKQSEDELMAEWQLQFDKNFKIVAMKVVALWFLSYIAFVLSFFISIEGETIPSLVQRSGSIMVMMALLADIQSFSFNHFLPPSKRQSVGYDIIRKQNASKVRWFQGCSILIAIMGTMIWGYGDLIMKSYGY